MKAELCYSPEMCSKYPEVLVSLCFVAAKFYPGEKQLGPHTLHVARRGI